MRKKLIGELETLRELARLPAISFESAGRAVVQLRTVNVVGERAHNIIRELGNALALSGNMDLTGTIRGLQRMIAESRILDEELDQITDRAPIFTQFLRTVYGVTRAEGLRNLGITPDRLVQDFLTRGPEIIPRANIDAASNVFQNFRIAIRDLAAEIGQLALPTLTREVKELTEFLRSEGVGAVTRMEQAFNKLEPTLSKLSETIIGVVRNLGELWGNIKLFAIGAGFIAYRW